MNKKILFFIAVFGLATAAQANLILTGVVDGPLPGGTPKAIEIFVTADTPDLSLYGVGSANNGDGSDGEELTFSGSALAGDFIWVASESTEFTNFFGYAPTYVSGAANINGDDAIELFFNGNVIDIFGDINVDGTGEPWDHLDGWAYRNDATGPDGTAFALGNWSFSGTNALDNETSNATAASPVPFGTYAIPEPSMAALMVIGIALIGRFLRKK